MKLSATFTISSGGPSATILPPPVPPSGPMSRTQSAVLRTATSRPWRGRRSPPRASTRRATTTIGKERVDYGHLLEAHTDGDIYVFFRDSNVLAVGDALSPERDPELDWFGGGWLGGRVDSLKLLLGLGDARTKIVPSYGPIVDRTAVQKEHDMLLRLFESFVELVRKGYSAEDVLAAGVMGSTGRDWADPLKFVRAAHKGMWAHHNTLSPDVV